MLNTCARTLSDNAPEEALAFVAPSRRLEVGNLEVVRCRARDRIDHRLHCLSINVYFLHEEEMNLLYDSSPHQLLITERCFGSVGETRLSTLCRHRL